MNPLDYILLAIVILSIVPAILKGFIHEVLMLAATVLGIALAEWRFRLIARMLPGWIHAPGLRALLAFGLILFGVLVGAAILGKILTHAASALGLGWANRCLGAVLGLVRGVLVCTVVIVMLTAFPFDASGLRQSRFAPVLLVAGRGLVRLLPGATEARFHAGVDRLRGLSAVIPWAGRPKVRESQP